MPNRIIKDSIRTSRTVNAMTDFQFRLWVCLITYVDDYGRGSADPDLLKGFVFPRRRGVSKGAIEKALTDLAGIGAILLYEVDGEAYFCFPNWGNHQRIQTKRSKFPAPSEGTVREATVSHGELPPEYNPIQSETESESETETETESESRAFERFWAVYPKKVGKKDARKAFGKVKADVQTLVDAVERQKLSNQWCKDGGQYIPYPATWLNQERWTDEMDTGMGHAVPYGASGRLGAAELEAIENVMKEPE